MKSSVAAALVSVFLGGLAAQAQQVPMGFNALSPMELDAEVLKEWESLDVVEVMKLVGMDEGLEDLRILEIFGSEGFTLATEGEKLQLKKDGYHFMDITGNTDLGHRNAQRFQEATFAHAPTSEVNALTASILDDLEDAIPNMRGDIVKLSSFWNRNYRSPWGLASSNWVHDHVAEILAKHTKGLVTNITKFSHNFMQNSVIARIETEPVSADKEIIIIGAHQDSLNYPLPFYRAPGSDDDGSGTVTNMQILRSLIEHDFLPPSDIAIEFHWYAAEEGGLLGSQDIAAAYEKAEKNVKSMFQMDMTAYVKPGTTPVIGLFKDRINMNLTQYLGSMADKYTRLDWNLTSCGPSCGSDHMSWTKAGYPAAFAIEALFENTSPKIHSMHDHWDDENYSFEHMLEFVKLGLAYITELSVSSPVF